MQIAQNEQWQRGDWEYTWNANGSLKSVKLPDGEIVAFEYDALGRRTKKIFNNKIIRYLWDNNVLLHEWEYEKENAPRRVVNKLGEVSFDKPEPINNLITWVYETGSFVPCAKIVGNETFSIINDYIGRPIQAYDNNGNLVWQTDYDIYGGLRNLKGDREFIPFRQLGQYEDCETSLYYNRFRYYSPDTGSYISKDPIGLLGNNPNLYAYVFDSNTQIDILGLFLDKTHLHHTIPREIYNPRSGKAPLLPAHLLNNKDIIGKKGSPNRWEMPATEHIALHKKNRIGGDYNSRWKKELIDLEKIKPRNKWEVDDILNIRDKLTKEFDIDKYRPTCK